MRPKEQAEKLIKLFIPYVDSLKYSPMSEMGDAPSYNSEKELENAKKCAKKAVDEIIEESTNYLSSNTKWMRPSDRVYQTNEQRNIYWQEVKQEIKAYGKS